MKTDLHYARYIVGWLAVSIGVVVGSLLLGDPGHTIFHALYWSTGGYAVAIWMHCGEER